MKANENDRGRLYAVGHPIDGITGPHREGPTYTFHFGTHVLECVYSKPTDYEAGCFQRGQVRLGVWEDPPVLWIVFHIEGLNWANTPYTAMLTDPRGRDIPEPADREQGAKDALTMVLADADDGTVKGLRVITLPAQTAVKIREGARRQKLNPFHKAAYIQHIERRFREMPDPAQMAEMTSGTELLGT